jgi:tartronate-semialdehyde synthase
MTQAFGVPGAAINPLVRALRERQSIAHILARHVEAASHMAEGYTRAGRQHRRVHRHQRPGRHRHDHRPVLGQRRQHPHPVHHRPGAAGAPVQGRLPGRGHREHQQAGHQVGVTVREPAQVPRAFQQAFHLMRSGRPGPVLIDLPFDVQMAEIEFDIDTYEPLPVYKPAATRKQIEKALDMLAARASR